MHPKKLRVNERWTEDIKGIKTDGSSLHTVRFGCEYISFDLSVDPLD